MRVEILCLLWFSGLFEVKAREAKSIVKRAVNVDTDPYYNLNFTEQHRHSWRPRFAAQQRLAFEEHLRQSLGPSDFLYIFTGDTQHWHPCTRDNAPCHRATDFCASKQQQSGNECNQKQSEFANKIQQISMAALNRRLNNGTGRRPILGLVINGDLTDFGHDDELIRLKKLWTTTNFDNSIKVYPGLGNHDYDNNVGNCALDQCVNRRLRWFRSYVKDTLQLRLDLRTSSRYLVAEDNSGSFAYSWDQCVVSRPSTCFHFIQLNNFPTYAKLIDGWLYDWKILPSLNWLSNDLRREGANKSVIINFHDFDTSFSIADKLRFRKILDTAVANSTNTRILAIFFAHIHELVGVKEWWCIGGRKVPLIYSGSVPGNNYVVAHFSPSTGAIKVAYSVKAESETNSFVQIEPISEIQESCRA